ncbi:hypothetical protein N431DRAFT_446563 [Stipitochalara longipes BDJ]|nr:hypothetical protein N431DRAFT_446563 [Stipitochalara longipes BDJ]
MVAASALGSDTTILTDLYKESGEEALDGDDAASEPDHGACPEQANSGGTDDEELNENAEESSQESEYDYDAFPEQPNSNCSDDEETNEDIKSGEAEEVLDGSWLEEELGKDLKTETDDASGTLEEVEEAAEKSVEVASESSERVDLFRYSLNSGY